MRIHSLPALLVNQIAAGEVIERPASIIKECVENSLDAGASQISIEIENAGMGLIRVIDNGHGINEEDMALALSRHATSKIHEVEDLFAIDSMGFRGEALASIASVAKVKLTSCQQNANQAFEIVSENGVITQPLPASHANGCTIEIRDLFYNVPVRRKFLKSEKTELHHILTLFKKFVLSHFSVAFSLKCNQRRYHYPAAINQQQISGRIKKIFGSGFIEQAVYIDVPYDDMRLTGWVGGVSSAKRQAEHQYFFINQRMVKDKLIQHALKNAYQLIAVKLMGLYPSYALYLEIPSSQLDVNVHPTKHEVRFVQASLVHDFVEKCISEALLQIDRIEEPQEPIKKLCIPEHINTDTYSHPMQANSQSTLTLKSAQMPKFFQQLSAIDSERNHQAFPILNHRWLLFEHHQGFFLIDLMIAKEKIFLEFMDTSLCNQLQKPALFPIVLSVDNEVAHERLAFLKQIGFEIYHLNEQFKITHVPFFLLGQSISEILEYVLSGNVQTLVDVKHVLLEYIDISSVSLLPSDWLTGVFKDWLDPNQTGPWLYFSFSELDAQTKSESRKELF